jgi:hypothetical protein
MSKSFKDYCQYKEVANTSIPNAPIGPDHKDALSKKVPGGDWSIRRAARHSDSGGYVGVHLPEKARLSSKTQHFLMGIEDAIRKEPAWNKDENVTGAVAALRAAMKAHI